MTYIDLYDLQLAEFAKERKKKESGVDDKRKRTVARKIKGAAA